MCTQSSQEKKCSFLSGRQSVVEVRGLGEYMFKLFARGSQSILHSQWCSMRDPAAELTSAGISSLLNFSSSVPSEDTLTDRAV